MVSFRQIIKKQASGIKKIKFISMTDLHKKNKKQIFADQFNEMVL
jgi:hypothetical protein